MIIIIIIITTTIIIIISFCLSQNHDRTLYGMNSMSFYLSLDITSMLALPQDNPPSLSLYLSAIQFWFNGFNLPMQWHLFIWYLVYTKQNIQNW